MKSLRPCQVAAVCARRRAKKCMGIYAESVILERRQSPAKSLVQAILAVAMRLGLQCFSLGPCLYKRDGSDSLKSVQFCETIDNCFEQAQEYRTSTRVIRPELLKSFPLQSCLSSQRDKSDFSRRVMLYLTAFADDTACQALQSVCETALIYKASRSPQSPYNASAKNLRLFLLDV